jgi:hypothetical protein
MSKAIETADSTSSRNGKDEQREPYNEKHKSPVAGEIAL